jgi:Domain of unknown function (DUF4287)
MKTDYWNVSDEQVVAKTGEPTAHWINVLNAFGASTKKSVEAVKHLQTVHGVPRYWARTLVTLHSKRSAERTT